MKSVLPSLLLTLSLLLQAAFVFCNVINSPIINKVCVVATSPHSPSHQLQHVLRSEKLHTRQCMLCALISLPASRAQHAFIEPRYAQEGDKRKEKQFLSNGDPADGVVTFYCVAAADKNTHTHRQISVSYKYRSFFHKN